MEILTYISSIILPLIVLGIVISGIFKKVDIYNVFVGGAKDGLNTVLGILPSLIGLMCGVAVLRGSGFLEFVCGFFMPLIEPLGLPPEILPLSVMKAVSSSGATGLLTDIFKQFGPDSFVGRVSSVLMGSTETIFYTMSVYYLSIGVKNSRYTLQGAVIANIFGVIASYFAVLLFFGR